MRYITKVRSRAAAARDGNRQTRAARVGAFLIPCLCLSMTWIPASSTAAAACTTPTFGPPTFYGAGAVRAFTTADFDGDGNTDLASVTSTDVGLLLLYLGDGTGAFPLRGTYNNMGRRAQSIAAGDFDSDGLPDVAIANGGPHIGQVSVYLNRGLTFDEEVPVRWSDAGTGVINRLTARTLTRAQVLRAVADSDAVAAAEFNNAFVAMQYYGYLRRKPDNEGFQAWLRVLQAGNVRAMVDGFLNSVEYKLRFGQP